MDIKLRQWTEQALPAKAVECGWETLKSEFARFMEKAAKAPDHDDIFDQLKAAVVNEALQQHVWEDKASEMLRVIQLNTLEDRTVNDKRDWDQAVKFLESSVREKLKQNEDVLRQMIGPTAKERWLYWQYLTEDQKKRNYVKSEVDKVLYSDQKHPPTLSYDELTTIRKNLQRNNIDVDNEYIREVWHPIYRRHFLNQALGKTYDCRKAYYLYHQQSELTDCSDVVLFHRIQQMLKVTANALRQQIMNREGKCV